MNQDVCAFIAALTGFVMAAFAHALHIPGLALASLLPAGIAVYLLIGGKK